MTVGCCGCWLQVVWLYMGASTLRRLEGLPLPPWFCLFWDPQIMRLFWDPQPCWVVTELARADGGDLAKSANWQMTNWKASKGTEETMGVLDTCRTQRCLVLMNNLVCKSSKQWMEKKTKPQPLKNGAERDIKNKLDPSPPHPPIFIKGGDTCHRTGVRFCCWHVNLVPKNISK